MCTVTFIARRNGYALGMNRDEKLTRAVGLPPRLRQLGRRTILAPSEPSGGTWIGVNDTGATFALINWYSSNERVTHLAFSRGEIVKASLPASSPASVEKILTNLPLRRANPFRLIGIFLTTRTVVEWRWNLSRLEQCVHRWETRTWISSGFDEPGAQESRGKVFRDALRQSSVGSLDWLRRLHGSHRPRCGAYSHCMHRAGAATVSYTEVAVGRQKVTMRYVAGPPCCTPRLPAVVLDTAGVCQLTGVRRSADFRPLQHPTWPAHSRIARGMASSGTAAA